MSYVFTGEYRADNPELDLMSSHAFSQLLIDTSLLINHINTGGVERVAFSQDVSQPSAPRFVAQKQPDTDGLWYAGAYLPSAKSKPDELIMNCAVFTVDPRHDLRRAELVDVRRDHYGIAVPGNRFSRRLSAKMTRVLLKELTVETDTLSSRFDAGNGDWEVS